MVTGQVIFWGAFTSFFLIPFDGYTVTDNFLPFRSHVLTVEFKKTSSAPLTPTTYTVHTQFTDPAFSALNASVELILLYFRIFYNFSALTLSQFHSVLELKLKRQHLAGF